MALVYKDLSRIKQLIASIQDSSSYSGWLLLGHQDNKTLVLQGHGNGGAEEIVPLLDQTQVQYGLIRLRENSKDGGLEHTSAIATRDIYFCVKGNKLSVMHRQRGLLLETVAETLSPHHAKVEVLNADKFNDENLLDRATNAGSHVIE